MKRLQPAYYARNAHRIASRLAGALLLSSIRKSPLRKKLLIVKPDAIGDQILFSFVLSRIRVAFPGHEVTILVQGHVAEYYRKCPLVDAVLPFDKRRYYGEFAYPFHWMRRIRKERFAVVLHAVLSRDTAGDQISIASGAPRVIGLEGDQVTQPAWMKRLHDIGYTEIILETAGPGAFEGHRYLSIPSHLDVPVREEEWKPVVWLDETDRNEAGKVIRGLGLSPKRFAAVAPGSGVREKCWFAEGFAAVSDRISRERGLSILLVGAPGEEDLAEAVRRAMRTPCVSIVGGTSIPVLAALLAEAALVVGNDSGPIHFAMAAGTPAVCVMGGGHYGRFVPYPAGFPLRCVTRRMECFGCDWDCRYDAPLCITHVTPEEVWDAVVELME